MRFLRWLPQTLFNWASYQRPVSVVLSVLLSAICPIANVVAQEGSKDVTGSPVLPTSFLDVSALLKLAFGLAVVLGIFFAAAWLARRTLQQPAGAKAQLKIVSGMSLGSKDRVVLVRANDRELLLGQSSNGITVLYSWSSDHVDESVSQFSSVLASVSDRRTNANDGD